MTSAPSEPTGGASPGRLIILEGPDGAGKSTLAKDLCQAYSAEYHHEGPPPPHVDILDYYGGILEGARIRGGNHVFDRLAYGEMVYGPVFRGVDRLTPAGWRVFKRLIDATNTYLVLCLPERDVAFYNWMQRQHIEMVTQVEQYEEIYARYQLSAPEHHFVYDYKRHTPSDVVGAYELWLEGQPLPLPVGAVGSPGWTYLLVGERGSNPAALADLPFFSTKHSSGFLTEALDLAGFMSSELAYANFWMHNGKQLILDNFEPRKVIALGSRAAMGLRAIGVRSFCEVPHPQYVKRFRHNDIAWYADELRRCR